jgi:hypothetical protein
MTKAIIRTICYVAVILNAGCAFMYPQDFIRVTVYEKDFKPRMPFGNPIQFKSQAMNGVEFTYDSRLTDLKNRRYNFYIGSKVVSEYGGNFDRAVDDITKRVIDGNGLCSDGYKNIGSKTYDGLGGIVWNITCLLK